MEQKYLYMKVTKDRFELPLVVADSISELARMCGRDKGNVCRCIRESEEKGYRSMYVRVPMEDA